MILSESSIFYRSLDYLALNLTPIKQRQLSLSGQQAMAQIKQTDQFIINIVGRQQPWRYYTQQPQSYSYRPSPAIKMTPVQVAWHLPSPAQRSIRGHYTLTDPNTLQTSFLVYHLHHQLMQQRQPQKPPPRR